MSIRSNSIDLDVFVIQMMLNSNLPKTKLSSDSFSRKIVLIKKIIRTVVKRMID